MLIDKLLITRLGSASKVNYCISLSNRIELVLFLPQIDEQDPIK